MFAAFSDIRSHALILLTLCLTGFMSREAVADLFTVREDDGKTPTVEARFVGERSGVLALERTDGRIELIPQDRIVDRKAAEDPEPISPNTALVRLTEQFGRDKFRGHADSTYVIGLVLAEPLQKQYDAKATALLKKGANFMKLVEKVFLEFVDDLKIEIVKPRYPLVLLIFETDDDFIKYTNEATGGKGLSAGNILGYYSGLTNHLVIRMSECHTFETPLHEAIHQQVYNRGLLHRLSPAPSWFNEGIATGFEGNGERINSGPLKINTRYAKAAMRARNVNWDEVVADDRAFHGDVLAGEAYAHAWSIHWFLATKYRKQYIEYLQLLSQKQTLELDNAQERVEDFERIFGKRVGKLQNEFPQALEAAAKKQKVSLDPPKTPGYLLTQANLAEVELTAGRAGNGPMQAEGRMRNISYLRPMSFHVTVETNSGAYAEWFLPNVAPQKQMPLTKQYAQKQMQNAPGGPSQTFVVRVRAVVPDSDTGQQWQRGQLPVPVYRD